VQTKTEREILRFAQNDNVFGFSAASEAATCKDSKVLLHAQKPSWGFGCSGFISSGEKALYFVILSEAKNLSSIEVQAKTDRRRDSSLRSE
jgi:hypothetical protein